MAIECFVREFPGFRSDATVVAVDVIRATSTIAAAVLQGRRCYPVATIDAAVTVAETLQHPLLAGELGGHMPYGFDLDNSPAAVAARDDAWRPLVLVSTTGTQLICEAALASRCVYAACLRNYSAQAAHLMKQAGPVVIVGAGSRGEFREEDQLCCAWIAQQLLDAGFDPEGSTESIVERWRGASVADILDGNSSRFLRSTGRERDLEFILEHIDDADSVFEVRSGEVHLRSGRALQTS